MFVLIFSGLAGAHHVVNHQSVFSAAKFPSAVNCPVTQGLLLIFQQTLLPVRIIDSFKMTGLLEVT